MSANPRYINKLTVGNAVTIGGGLALSANTEEGSAATLTRYSGDAAADTPGLLLRRARGTTAAPAATGSGDTLGRLMFHGHTGSGFSFCASIRCYQDGAVGTRVPGRLVFETGTGSAGPASALTLYSDKSASFAGAVTCASTLKVTGNIGFYNATPAAKPTITGSRGGNAALASLLTGLAALGLVTDSTT